MTLKELIVALEKAPADRIVPHGFSYPHSYRGYYDQLAFEPRENVTAGAMLADAKSALGKTFKGYKGGAYKMDEWTDVWLAEYGCCGEGIGPTLLRYMLSEAQSSNTNVTNAPTSAQ